MATNSQLSKLPRQPASSLSTSTDILWRANWLGSAYCWRHQVRPSLSAVISTAMATIDKRLDAVLDSLNMKQHVHFFLTAYWTFWLVPTISSSVMSSLMTPGTCPTAVKLKLCFIIRSNVRQSNTPVYNVFQLFWTEAALFTIAHSSGDRTLLTHMSISYTMSSQAGASSVVESIDHQSISISKRRSTLSYSVEDSSATGRKSTINLSAIVCTADLNSHSLLRS